MKKVSEHEKVRLHKILIKKKKWGDHVVRKK